jgi:hypothetical protein
MNTRGGGLSSKTRRFLTFSEGRNQEKYFDGDEPFFENREK